MLTYLKILRGILLGIGLLITCAILMVILTFTIPTRQHARRVREVRPAALREAMRDGAPVIRAIEAYTRTEKHPPATLQALVPRYLPAVPAAPRLSRRGWHYDVGRRAGTEKWCLWLRVRQEYQPNRWSFGDDFTYHPSGKYAKYDHGGVLEPVGMWGYYNE